MTEDGAGGAVMAWQDDRYAFAPDIFAQRVNGAGTLLFPDAEYPVLVSVRDIPNDQGGRVKLSWKANNQDLPPFLQVQEYWIWRSAPSSAATQLSRTSSPLPTLEVAAALPSPPPLARQLLGSTTYYWEYIATQPAGHLTNYSYVASTTSDSIAGSNPLTAFMVMARKDNATWWYSNPDSGYSVDNLPPGTPLQFAATATPAAIALQWNVSPEPDFAEYRLYRGGSPGFVPGPGNLVSSQPDTGYADAITGTYWYKLNSRDSHGNESAYATATATSLVLGTPGTAGSSAVWFAPPQPNPMTREAVFRFDLAERGVVSLSILDASGRMVRRLAQGEHREGEHSVTWDGLDHARRKAPSGLYFATFSSGSTRVVRRLVRLD